MDVLTIPKTIASLEYTALRLPLTVAHKHVVGRFLPAESGVRIGFEKALGTLDVNVARLIGDDSRAARGAALTGKAASLATALELEEQAADRRDRAERELRQAQDAGTQQRRQAEQRASENAERVRAGQQSDKQAAAEQAAAEARARTQAVERERAAKLTDERSRHAEDVAAVQTRTAARTAAPAAKLQGAVNNARDAAEQQQTAARLDQLADAEKASRRRG